MSQRNRGLKQFGCTLPDSKRPRLVETFWRNLDPAIESSGLTMTEPSPQHWGKASMPTHALPRLWGEGILDDLALSSDSRT